MRLKTQNQKKLTIEKLLEIKEKMDEAEKNRPKYYDESGEVYIELFELEKE